MKAQPQHIGPLKKYFLCVEKYTTTSFFDSVAELFWEMQYVFDC